MLPYYVYILECEDKSLYTGITNDLKKRLKEHQNKHGGHYTSSHGAKRFVYTEKHKNKSMALKREVQIKKLKRNQKLALIR